MKSDINSCQNLKGSSTIDEYKSIIEEKNAKISDLEEQKSQLVVNLEELFNENKELKSTIEILQSTIENSSLVENFSRSGIKANKFTDNFKFINAGIIYLQENRYLEGLFTLVAIASTLTLAISDFSNVDKNGNLLTANSVRNTIVKESDFYFVIIFIFEAALKISALGLYSPKGAGYLNSYWNILDFIVVIISVLSISMDNTSDLTSIRALRAIRTMRIIRFVPGINVMIDSIVKALPELANVLIVLMTVCFMFAVAGVILFGGPYLHTRCRLTPFPVDLSWQPGQDPNLSRCLNESNFNILTHVPEWKTKSQSSWSNPQNCSWPIDQSIRRNCALTGEGHFKCPSGTWCGSNYDALGNFRFLSLNPNDEFESYFSELHYGLITFDNFGHGLITTFQIITNSSWNLILHNLWDATGALSILFTLFLLFTGAYGLMQLFLAVLDSSYYAVVDQIKGLELDNDKRKGIMTPLLNRLQLPRCSSVCQIPILNSVHLICKEFITEPYFENSVYLLVFVNAVVLSIDHYPIDATFSNILDVINYVLVSCFSIELIFKVVGMGMGTYLSDGFNVLDMLTVLLSIFELVTSPPKVLGGNDNPSGSFTALRVFRMFRIVKLFKISKVDKRFKALVDKLILTLEDLKKFGFPLVIFIFVYSVVGMQLYANKLRFDANGYAIKEIGSPEWINAAEIPEANFDDFPHSFAVVFQMITLDWMFVYQNLWRSAGPYSLFYTVSLVVFGVYILSNLFYTILLRNFWFSQDDLLELFQEENEKSSPYIEVSNEKENDSSLCKDNPNNDGFDGNEKCIELKEDYQDDSSSLVEDNPNSNDKDKCTELKDDDYQESNIFIGVNLNDNEKSAEIIYFQGSSILVEDSLNNNEKSIEIIDFQESSILIEDNSIDDEKCDEKVIEIYNNQNENQKEISNHLSNEINITYLIPNKQSSLLYTISSIRSIPRYIVESTIFQSLVIIITFVSSIALAFDSPLVNPGSQQKYIVGLVDVAVTLFFLLEFILKVLSYGIYNSNENSYCKNNWNNLDFLILVISILSIISENPELRDKIVGLRALRALKSLKVLRSVRLTSQFSGLKVIVDAMILSLPDVTYTFILSGFLWYIFALICLSFFKGQLKSCQGAVFDDLISNDFLLLKLLEHPISWNSLSDDQKEDWFGPQNLIFNASISTCNQYDWPNNPCCPQITSQLSHITSRNICECWGGEWKNDLWLSFDNIYESLFSIVQMSSLDCWSEVMWRVVKNNGIDMQPLKNNQIYWVYFFILLVLVCGFLSLYLFVGVLCYHFQCVNDQKAGLLLMTNEQYEWAKTQNVLLRIKPLKKPARPKNICVGKIYDIKNSVVYDSIIYITIFVSVIATSVTHFGQADQVTITINSINIICSTIFVSDIFISIISSPGTFYYDYMNLFDIVLGGLGDALVLINAIYGLNYYVVPIGIIRLLRVPKLFIAFDKYTSKDSVLAGTNRMIRTLMLTLPAIFNVACLLFLLLFIYATMGMQLFSKIEYYYYHNDNANFRDFTTALLTLIQLSTLNYWTYFMHSVAHSYPNCDPDPDFNSDYCGFSNHDGCIPLNGCGSYIIYPFVASFILIVSLVVLNLFIGVVIASYQEAYYSENKIRPKDIHEFTKNWAIFDPQASYFIDGSDLKKFISLLDEPLGFGEIDDESLEANIKNLNLHNFKRNKIHFRELLVELSLETLRKSIIENGDDAVIERPSKEKIFSDDKVLAEYSAIEAPIKLKPPPL